MEGRHTGGIFFSLVVFLFFSFFFYLRIYIKYLVRDDDKGC